MANHHEMANLIWQITDLLRGPCRPPQYERVMLLPLTVLRRLNCVLAPTKAKVLAEFEKWKDGKLEGYALDGKARFVARGDGKDYTLAQRTARCADCDGGDRSLESGIEMTGWYG